MSVFSPVTAQAIPLLKSTFKNQPFRSCDYTACVTFMWRDYFRTEYALDGNALWLRMRYPDGKLYYQLPWCEEPLRIPDWVLPEEGEPLRFSAVPEEMLDGLLKHFPNAVVTEERRWADYLYPREQLATYAGRKLAGQRNHVNRFVKTYGSWRYEPLSSETIPLMRNFLLSHWEELLKEGPSARAEYSYAIDLLRHAEALECTGGLLCLPNGEAVGICAGTTVGDTYYEHVEKALHSIPGASQLLCRECAVHVPEGVQFINREDDVGDPGLRTAKLALHPSALIAKYTVTIA